jgi:hypothetical protein
VQISDSVSKFLLGNMARINNPVIARLWAFLLHWTKPRSPGLFFTNCSADCQIQSSITGFGNYQIAAAKKRNHEAN